MLVQTTDDGLDLIVLGLLIVKTTDDTYIRLVLTERYNHTTSPPNG